MTRIEVSWTDNSTNESRFVVVRSESSSLLDSVVIATIEFQGSSWNVFGAGQNLTLTSSNSDPSSTGERFKIEYDEQFGGGFFYGVTAINSSGSSQNIPTGSALSVSGLPFQPTDISSENLGEFIPNQPDEVNAENLGSVSQTTQAPTTTQAPVSVGDRIKVLYPSHPYYDQIGVVVSVSSSGFTMDYDDPPDGQHESGGGLSLAGEGVGWVKVTTAPPTTQAPTTQAPTTQAPTTQAPTTQAPTTQAPALHKFNLSGSAVENIPPHTYFGINNDGSDYVTEYTQYPDGSTRYSSNFGLITLIDGKWRLFNMYQTLIAGNELLIISDNDNLMTPVQDVTIQTTQGDFPFSITTTQAPANCLYSVGQNVQWYGTPVTILEITQTNPCEYKIEASGAEVTGVAESALQTDISGNPI